MGGFLHRLLNFDCCKSPRLFLAMSWVTGLLAGLVLSSNLFAEICELVPFAIASPFSFAGIILATSIPFLLTVFVLHISKPFFLLPISLVKGILFSFNSFLFLFYYHSSGWLIRILIMFSDLITLPILWFLWLQSESNFGNSITGILLVLFAFVFLTCLFDYVAVAPFLAMLN